MNQKASELYRHPDHRLNCAQVLVHKWCERLKVSQLTVDDLRGMGSGRAPDGLCGALYGAVRIFEGNEGIQNKLRQVFEDKLGCSTCEGARNNKDYNCKSCIDLMDEAIKELVESVNFNDVKTSSL